MALFTSAAVLFALVALAAALVRRARRREAELEASLRAALQERARAHPSLRPRIEAGVVFAREDGSTPTLPWRRLMEAADRGHSAPAVAAAALELLASPPRPLAGAFSLKIHGPQVRIRLTAPAAMALRPREPRPAQTPLADLKLVATYLVGDRFVTEDQLREQGIDTRDLHGIALAVQRQRFDEATVRRVLASSPENPSSEVIDSTAGGAGAAVLTLADALRSGEALAARLAGPGRLEIAPLGHEWPARELDPAAAPVEAAIEMVVEPDGYRVL